MEGKRMAGEYGQELRRQIESRFGKSAIKPRDDGYAIKISDRKLNVGGVLKGDPDAFVIGKKVVGILQARRLDLHAKLEPNTVPGSKKDLAPMMLPMRNQGDVGVAIEIVEVARS